MLIVIASTTILEKPLEGGYAIVKATLLQSATPVDLNKDGWITYKQNKVMTSHTEEILAQSFKQVILHDLLDSLEKLVQENLKLNSSSRFQRTKRGVCIGNAYT